MTRTAPFTFRSDTDNLTIRSHANIELEALAHLCFDLEQVHGLPASRAKNFKLVEAMGVTTCPTLF